MKFLNRPRILVAGPWLSELGWELMVWQAAVRYQRITKGYEKTYVITFKNRQLLYEECQIYEHNEQLINADFGIGVVPQEKIVRLVQDCVSHFQIKEPFDLFTPNKFLSLRYKLMRKFRNDIMHKKFNVFPVNEKRFDIAFHFRAFERETDTNPKSFPQQKADRLVQLCLTQNLKVCCIGLPGYSYAAKDAENKQSDDLTKSAAVICASRLVVGGSSAPMHLAALCGVPIVVWIDCPGDNRYYTYGNPLGSKVFMVSDKTFNPDVDEVFQAVKQAIA